MIVVTLYSRYARSFVGAIVSGADSKRDGGLMAETADDVTRSTAASQRN